MSHELYELDVRLRGIEPPIWRTLELPGAATLEEVHHAIQVAMGWTNSHLHQFVIGKVMYAMAGMDDAGGGPPFEDDRQFRLRDVAKAGDKFLYEYDFGDDWEHDVTVVRVTAVAKAVRPRCVDGARACPPEDCGGPHGYADLVESYDDPTHERHRALRDWIGDGFAPERFAIPKGGRDLQPGMTKLQRLLDAHRKEAEAAADDDDDDVDDVDGLPRHLIDEVLALDPMRRASLGALIAGSLASELVELGQIAQRLAGSAKPRAKPARAHRSRRAR